MLGSWFVASNYKHACVTFEVINADLCEVGLEQRTCLAGLCRRHNTGSRCIRQSGSCRGGWHSGSRRENYGCCQDGSW